jgi:Mlc titration factor MtfA (ptsG expression regulator)
LHEFAHQLDMLNGRLIDGTPLLSSRQQYDRWQQVIRLAHERLQRDCRKGWPTVLDCYGAESLGEFIAVSTECFFGRPTEMLRIHSEVYEILRDYYRQDPSAREKAAARQLH